MSEKLQICEQILDFRTAAQNVFQTPLDVIKLEGELISGLRCSHKDSNFEHILWYKQGKSAKFKLLGFLNAKSASPEDDVKDGVGLSGDGRSSATLSIKNLTVEDSAVYFCAARRHSGQSISNQINQTHNLIKFTHESIHDNELTCSHSIPSFDRTLWYKQEKSGSIVLLGFMNLNFLNLEEGVQGKMTLKGDGRSQTSLSISNLTVEDSAVYYCAPSLHSDKASLAANQKLHAFKHICEHLRE
ncbi:uncharacterized protein [Eucyclogobius newberryi]|uniref:uncharacterized protein n=1 Tax=Eucyclogobius newberryi TaxID=166745 RepID=UPI003B5A7490